MDKKQTKRVYDHVAEKILSIEKLLNLIDIEYSKDDPDYKFIYRQVGQLKQMAKVNLLDFIKVKNIGL